MVAPQSSSEEEGAELQATSGSSTSFSTAANEAPSPSPSRKVVPDAVVRAPPGLKLDDGAPGRMVVIRDGKTVAGLSNRLREESAA